MTARQSNPRRTARAFTFVELVVAMAVAGVIMAATASCLILAAKAVDDGKGPTTRTLAAHRAASHVLADLEVATAFTERTDKALTFTVPDRNGDGQPETVRYAWSGTPGDPLTRQYNGGTADPIATDVRNLSLSFLTRTVAPPAPKEVESAEQELASYYNPATMNATALASNCWVAEHFRPTLPPNVVYWKITRVRLLLRRNGTATGTTNIQIRRVHRQSGLPTGDVLASVAVEAASVPTTNTWVDIPFSTLAGLGPTDGLAVVATTAAAKAPLYMLQDNSVGAPGMVYSLSSDSGGKWAGSTSKTVHFYVYGTVTTLN